MGSISFAVEGGSNFQAKTDHIAITDYLVSCDQIIVFDQIVKDFFIPAPKKFPQIFDYYYEEL
jgi:hypothetical protein